MPTSPQRVPIIILEALFYKGATKIGGNMIYINHNQSSEGRTAANIDLIHRIAVRLTLALVIAAILGTYLTL